MGTPVFQPPGGGPQIDIDSLIRAAQAEGGGGGGGGTTIQKTTALFDAADYAGEDTAIIPISIPVGATVIGIAFATDDGAEWDFPTLPEDVAVGAFVTHNAEGVSVAIVYSQGYTAPSDNNVVISGGPFVVGAFGVYLTVQISDAAGEPGPTFSDITGQVPVLVLWAEDIT
jgi:hypothetical protein